MENGIRGRREEEGGVRGRERAVAGGLWKAGYIIGSDNLAQLNASAIMSKIFLYGSYGLDLEAGVQVQKSALPLPPTIHCHTLVVVDFQ